MSWALGVNALSMLKILVESVVFVAGAGKTLGGQCLGEVLETSMED